MTDLPEKRGVLVVDDDESQRSLLVRVLAADWDVYAAGDVAEAEDLLARHPVIEVMLCDHQLPGENGLDYCQRLFARKAPVLCLMMTGYSDEALVLQALNSQAIFRYLVKPFGLDALKYAVSAAFREMDARKWVLEKRLETEAREVQQHPLREAVANRAQMIFGVMSLVLFAALVLIVVVGVVGGTVFLLLYFLKSFLGIDLFQDMHLSDWF